MRKLLTMLVFCLVLGLVVACQPAPSSQTGGSSDATPTVLTDGGMPTSTVNEGEVLATPTTEASPTAAEGGEETTSEVPADLSDVVITMERTVCFGTCPAYTVTVFGDGTVQYVGTHNVDVEGEQSGQISEEQVRDLVTAFYEADFFNMEDRYEANVTDLPSTTVTITIGGETKSVFDYVDAPEALKDLEAQIDEISGANEWVGRDS